VTGIEFFASIGLPALLVVCAYASVVIYERTNRTDADDAHDKPDAKQA